MFTVLRRHVSIIKIEDNFGLEIVYLGHRRTIDTRGSQGRANEYMEWLDLSILGSV